MADLDNIVLDILKTHDKKNFQKQRDAKENVYYYAGDIGKELKKRAMRILDKDEGFMINPGVAARACLAELYKKEQVVPLHPEVRPIMNKFWRVKDSQRPRPEGRVIPNEMLAEIASNLPTYESIHEFAQGNKDTLAIAQRELFERAKCLGFQNLDRLSMRMLKRVMKLREMGCSWITTRFDLSYTGRTHAELQFDLIMQLEKKESSKYPGTQEVYLNAIAGTKFEPKTWISFNELGQAPTHDFVAEYCAPYSWHDYVTGKENVWWQFHYNGEHIDGYLSFECFLWASGVYRITMKHEEEEDLDLPESIDILAIFSLPTSQLDKYEKKWYPYQREGDIKPPTGLI